MVGGMFRCAWACCAWRVRACSGAGSVEGSLVLVNLWLEDLRKWKWKKERNKWQREERKRKSKRKRERPTTPLKYSPITTNITGYLHPTFLRAFAQPERGVVEALYKPFIELCMQRRKTVSIEVLLLVCVASVVVPQYNPSP